MENLKGMGFDAVGIESSFKQFFKREGHPRGEFYDADVFRMGQIKDLAQVVERTAKELEQRLQKIKFTATDLQQGGAKARIEMGIHGLRTIAAEMKKSKDTEKDDYHWLLIGNLVACIDGLLLHLGA